MRYLSFVALFFMIANVGAQSLSNNRHTTELTYLLERDAISALSRQHFVESFYIVCKRVSAKWSESASEQHQSWNVRNQNHLQVAVAVVEAIGANLEKIQNVRAKQTYFTSVYRFVESAGNAEAARWLDGASPENNMVPSGERCLAQLASFQARDSEFEETPEQTIHLRAYAKRYFPELMVR